MPGLDALFLHLYGECRPVPFTDEVGQLEVLPPTPSSLSQFEDSVEEQRLRGEPCEGQVER